MKISIWQQFSSNHSNDFEVVGVFKSVESAVEAREKLREILHLILEFGIDYQDGVPNFAEFVTAKEFDIEWPQTLDWVSDEMHEVVQFDHYVWCGNIVGETWLGAPPIDKLMQKLGGEILVYQEMGLMVLAAELTCTAPNHKTAKKIFADLQPYLELDARRKDTTKSLPGVNMPTSTKHITMLRITPTTDTSGKSEKSLSFRISLSQKWDTACPP